MFNLIEYSSNCSVATGSLRFYSKDEAADFNVDIINDNKFKSFKYKAKLLGNKETQSNPNHANGITKNATIATLLKYLSNFRRSLEMPLINCQVELKVKWTICLDILSAAGSDNFNGKNANGIIFTIKETKLYVPVVTLSAIDKQKLPKLLSKGFERSF